MRCLAAASATKAHRKMVRNPATSIAEIEAAISHPAKPLLFRQESAVAVSGMTWRPRYGGFARCAESCFGT
jgi:hypothetical protein